MEGFYPQNSAGYTVNSFASFGQALPLITLIISLTASSFGMTKFFLTGPIQILPKDSPLNGLISLPFISMLFINCMFGIRVVCIENAFFSSYRYRYYPLDGTPTIKKAIDPIIPPEYRLLVYLAPSCISFIINAVRLISTGTKFKQYIKKYPQILLASCFTPFMFESCKINGASTIRIWKLGTILNAFYIGCVPQIVLLVTDFQRGIIHWDFLSLALEPEKIYENNDALLKSPYGNIMFAIISCIIFTSLIFLFFFTDKIFKNIGIYCKCFTILCCPCPQNFTNLTSQFSTSHDLQTAPNPNEDEHLHGGSNSGKNSKENEEPDTQIFFYTRENKIWVIGKLVSENDMPLTEVLIIVKYYVLFKCVGKIV